MDRFQLLIQRLASVQALSVLAASREADQRVPNNRNEPWNRTLTDFTTLGSVNSSPVTPTSLQIYWNPITL